MTQPMDPIEILTQLVKMYDDGRLAAEYDNDSNSLVNSQEVRALAEAARVYMPPRLEGDEAAKAMRSLPDDVRDEAIASSGSKVIDMRAQFREKIRLNGGSYGLLEQLYQAMNTNDDDKEQEVMELIVEFFEEDA